MSSALALNVISGALRHLLYRGLAAQEPTRSLVGPNEQVVTFSNPKQAAGDPSIRLSLWLYEITENEFMKNAAPVRGDSDDRSAPTTLALNLYYLLTPFSQTSESDLLLLGKSLQVMYDNAVAYVRSVEDDVAEELRIILCRLSLDEITRIWEALQEPYRLSVCYQVRVVRVASERMEPSELVMDADAGFEHVGLTPVGEGM